VIHVADENGARGRLLLEMAAQAEGLVARDQQPRIHAAVRVVARRAAFAHRLMLEHERTALRRVAPDADIIGRLQVGHAAFNHRALVRIVAVDAAHLPFYDRMMGRQIELGLLVQVALETGFG